MNDQGATGVGLSVELDHRINFAMQQNDVPPVKRVRVTNGGDPLRDLTLRVTTEPPVSERWECRLESLAPGATYERDKVDLVLSPKLLGELTERVRGVLRCELLQGQDQLAQTVVPIELLAHDEWSGLSSLPEILAAFVTPNAPAVERLLSEAARMLGGWTGDPSLSGYQSKDSKRVFTMVGAIYAALQQLDITYINPPASFESNGQRIRLPERIVETKLATCLDLAVLSASCLEQAGLHPIVVLVRAHAFVAVWLQEETFGVSAVEDPLRIRKRIELDEIVAFDPTCVSTRPSPDFKYAMKEAKRRLEAPEEFLCAIDVARARKGRIRPLPQRVEAAIAAPDMADALDGTARSSSAAPDASGISAGIPSSPMSAEPRESAKSRIDRWCRKLLDLSLRNRLLNLRSTKTSIPLLCPDAAMLEDALAGGAVFQLRARPRELGIQDPRDPDVHRRRTGDDGLAMLLMDEMKSKRLYADLDQVELDRRLIETYRAARVGIEEGGASALYLSIGSLVWYETPKSTQPRIAPLLLLPLELHRRSVQEGFTLRLGDDEPRLNVSLVEMLKQDHAVLIEGLDPLPEDAAGLDVQRILRVFREAVKDLPRWDVNGSVQLGIFSFAKFLMWRDLAERAADLMHSPVVDHLVNHSGRDFEPGGHFPHPDDLDDEFSPAKTYCPLPADASQLAAVFAAAAGRSFVLEGPPGTGKSQTITNLIAHCLAEGKRVLFVSEKMAALNVVYDRLRKVGLSRFCLELHSNKAQKPEVLAQLSHSLAHAETKAPAEWERESQHLQALRQRLNGYALALHKPRSTGESVFHATSQLIGLRDVEPVALKWDSVDGVDADALSALRDVVARVATTSAAVGEVSNHAWAVVKHSEWTPVWQARVLELVQQLLVSVDELQSSARDLSSRLALGDGGWSLDKLQVLDEVAVVLTDPPPTTTAILVQPEWDEIHSRIGTWLEHGRKRDGLRAAVFKEYSEAILDLDLEGLRTTLRAAGTTWWPKSWWQRRQVRQAFRPVSTSSGVPPEPAALAGVISKALELRQEEHLLVAAGDQARLLLGRHWNDGRPAWEAVDGLRAWAGRLRAAALHAADADPKRAADLRSHWAELATEGRALLQPESAAGREIIRFRLALAGFQHARVLIDNLLKLDGERVWGSSSSADLLGVTKRAAVAWMQHGTQLREWCAWRRCRDETVRQGLLPLIEAFERGAFDSRTVRRVFERSFYTWWHAAIVSGEPVLAQFFGPEHASAIEQFRDIDARLMSLTQQVITARLAERVPISTGLDLPNSEVGILKREMGKKRRQMPVRQLFKNIPNLLPRLKPCLLMSPMSVAQYLDGGRTPFDIVVFDEASQIPVWDAIGAIARGKQAIIVGDPKQLPPTNFFHRADDSDGEPGEGEEVEDLESILDDCIGSGLPTSRLRWHYRSRHESLIAFSNFHYYDNDLLTFPSPMREGLGVTWRHVPDGVYDRGKSATNRGEAQAVVAEIVRRVKLASPGIPSLGVVTFSQAQQTLIEDLLEETRRMDAQVDAAFAETSLEPIFVKNLENVQGDERDVILFSVCYGPDETGKVSMHFGPMNRDGGERRLNVAVTRARTEVLVFSTLRADQINLSRTRARGVRDLKNFLEYAEKGPSALASKADFDHAADVESPFEKDVRDVLVNRGWEVHCQVGCASYRIDLAVIDPKAAGRYLLGIECDGANYHRAKTARDRDKLREGVLRGLGWKLYRIWSTDWWTNPQGEIAKLEAALDAAMKAEPSSSASSASVSPPSATPPEVARISQTAAPKPPSAELQSQPVANHPVYAALSFKGVRGTQEDFYGGQADRQIAELLVAVVVVEGPVSLSLAAKRVAAHWHFDRVRVKALDRIQSLVLRDHIHLENTSRGCFLWPRTVNPEQYSSFRVPGNDAATRRDAIDLPPREVANAVLHVLKQHISAPRADLAREVGNLFGFGRTGSRVEECMLAGIDVLVASGAVVSNGDMITLPSQ